MRLLKDITPQSNHYSTEVKLSMLQNAVLIVPNLSSIRDISNNLVAIGNNPLGYQAYSEFLISACNQLDKDLEITHSKSKRTDNYTNFKEEDYSTEVKLSMLQNAVSIVPNLSSIRDISESQRGSTVLPSATA